MNTSAMMEDHKKALSTLWDIGSVALPYAALVGLCFAFGGFKGPGAPFWALKAFKADWPVWWIGSFGGCAIAAAVAAVSNPFRGGGEYGSARFATFDDVKKWGLFATAGVILGVFKGRYLRFENPLSVLVVAPPDSGKTAGIIIPNLLSCGNSTLNVDVKGELYEKTAKHRAKFSRVLLFAPGEKESVSWNPLSKAELPEDWDDVMLRVDRIAQILYTASAAENKDPTWLDNGKAVFRFYALYLVHKDGETSIPGVRAFALSQPDPQLAIAVICEEAGLPLRIKELGYRFVNMPDRQWGGVWGAFNDRLDVFSDPRVDRNFRTSDFQIESMRKERISLYLKVAPVDMLRLFRCLGLFIEFAALTLQTRERQPGEFLVTFFVDEFPRLPPMPTLLNMPALSRGYGVNVVFVVQGESQVVELYSEAGLATLKQTCGYRVYFSSNDEKVAQSISTAIGPRTRDKRSFSSAETRLTRNTSETTEAVPLLSAQDLMNLPPRSIVVLKQNNFATPVVAQDARWYLDRALKPLVM